MHTVKALTRVSAFTIGSDRGRRALEDMRQAVSDRDARRTAGLTRRGRRRLIELLSTLLPDPGHPAIGSAEYLVAQAHYRLRRLGDALLAGTGLRTRHFAILPAIDQIGPCSQQQLARYLSITEPAAAESVDELVRAGLVAGGRRPATAAGTRLSSPISAASG